MPFSILIAGDAVLRASLGEQFARLSDYALIDQPVGALPALLRAAPPEALLIADDLAQPGAAALTAQARALGYAGLVVLLAAGTQETPAGADARLARPFRFDSLLALLDELREGAEAFAGAEEKAARARLTEKEAAIFDRLAQEKGAAVSREALLREVWGYHPAATTRTLETHIHRLRRKIEEDPARPKRLLTEPGGYRLAGEGSDS